MHIVFFWRYSDLKTVCRVFFLLLVHVLLPEVLAEGLQARPVVAAHAVVVVDARLRKVHDGQAPVHTLTSHSVVSGYFMAAM